MWLRLEGLNTGHEIYVQHDKIESIEICNGHTDCKEDDSAIRFDMGNSFYAIKYTEEAIVLLNEAIGLSIKYIAPKIQVDTKSTVQ